MKYKTFIVLILVLSFSTVSNLFSYRNGWNNKNTGRLNNRNQNYNPEAYINSLPREEISEIEKEALLKMREEEKLARDVYRVLYEKWGLQVFYNISLAEQQHMDTIKILLTKYGIADPVLDDSTGVFTNAELLSLYNQLIKKGDLTIEDALFVGATIEDVDIFDLQNYQLKVDNQDIIFVFANLKKGSENHMRAFTRQLDYYDITYTAQYITQEELDAILAAEQGGWQGGRRGF